MIKILTGLLVLGSTLLATKVPYLTDEQLKNTKTVYKIGKNIVAPNGMTFGYSLAGMLAQESSWGTISVGDRYDRNGRLKSLYDSSLGSLQVKLSTAKLTIKSYPKLMKKYGYMLNQGKSTYKEYALHKKMVEKYYKILNNPIWIKRLNQGELKAIKTMKWANKEYNKHRNSLKINKKQSMKDTILINALINNLNVNAEIAGYYLLSMYIEAIKKGYVEPLKQAIGRYNGGWNNTRYFSKVKNKKRIIKKLLKQGKLKF